MDNPGLLSDTSQNELIADYLDLRNRYAEVNAIVQKNWGSYEVLYDLNRYLEDFFKDILNIVYGYKLVNLNEERSNNPGLDLGDEAVKVAFQVTSTKSSDKVNTTLEKAAAQLDKFPNIYIPTFFQVVRTASNSRNTTPNVAHQPRRFLLSAGWTC